MKIYENFVVKNYVGSYSAELKGNGFDGLEMPDGDDAQVLVDAINALRVERDRLRAEVERLCELLSDIKKFDIENNSLDLPQEIRARIQRALDNESKQEEGK